MFVDAVGVLIYLRDPTGKKSDHWITMKKMANYIYRFDSNGPNLQPPQSVVRRASCDKVSFKCWKNTPSVPFRVVVLQKENIDDETRQRIEAKWIRDHALKLHVFPPLPPKPGEPSAADGSSAPPAHPPVDTSSDPPAAANTC